MKDYCPHCKKFTEHREVEDRIFEYAIQCLVCLFVWEAHKDRLELAMDKDRNFISNPPESEQ